MLLTEEQVKEIIQAREAEIADKVINAARHVVACVQKAYPKKRIFPARGNHRDRRADKRTGQLSMALAPFFSAIDIAVTLSKPIPKHIKGM